MPVETGPFPTEFEADNSSSDTSVDIIQESQSSVPDSPKQTLAELRRAGDRIAFTTQEGTPEQRAVTSREKIMVASEKAHRESRGEPVDDATALALAQDRQKAIAAADIKAANVTSPPAEALTPARVEAEKKRGLDAWTDRMLGAFRVRRTKRKG